MGYYDYGFGYPQTQSVTEGAAGAVGAVMGILLMFYMLMMIYWVAAYVLYSLGIYKLAKRRGIHHAWLSWLPIGNVWVLGSISDQYQYVAKGRVRNRRKVLLGLDVAMIAACVLCVGFAVATILGVAAMAASGGQIGMSFGVMLLMYLAMIVLSIVLLVFEYIALYDLFASCDPGNAVLFLVLTICLGVVLPFFVFACRNKDLGMPPRKQVQPPVEELPAVEQTEE